MKIETKINKNKKGLTLIELIVVIVVIAILTGLSTTKFIGKIKDARRNALLNDLNTLTKASEQYYLENNRYPIKSTEYIAKEDFLEYINDNMDRGKFFEIDMELLSGKITKLKTKGTFILSESTNKVYYPKGVEDSTGKVYYELNNLLDIKPLKWLEKTDMIVTKESFSDLNNVPIGGVINNYDNDIKKFYNFSGNTKISILSLNTTLDASIEAYKITQNETFLEKSILMGNYIINNKINGTVYGQSRTFIASEQSSINNWQQNYDEIYIQDIAYSAYNCFKLYELTKEDKYKNIALEFMKTLNFSQDLFLESEDLPSEVKGNFPTMYIHGGSKTFSPTWNSVALDSVDMIVNAYEKAYKNTKNYDYNSRLLKYKTSILNILKNYGGINSNGFPYEYYCDRGDGWKGQNFDQLTGTWGIDKPFTTDQFFYCILGITKLDGDLGFKLYEKANSIQENYLFHGQYNVDGSPAYDKYEIINTAFFLELNKSINQSASYEPIERVLKENIFEDNSTDINSNFAYKWSTNSPDNVIESIATSRIIKALLK